ncbi:hypothetical protein [Umezawaea sp. NPDC059074]|uniref:hypothetical protein n=1 Tax=Umezawaea sp. NPDC059074 TaxID=3346716 RepID=UPI0036A19E06
MNGKFAAVRPVEHKGERVGTTVGPFFPVSASTPEWVAGEIDRFTEFRTSPTTLEWLD